MLPGRGVKGDKAREEAKGEKNKVRIKYREINPYLPQ
jgi:hypothetical protein